MRRLLGLVLIVALVATTKAQESARFVGSPTELVVLSVVVNDRRGHPVANLARDRFTVFDEDRVQPITLFSNEDTPVSVTVLIDISGSMRPKLGEVVLAALAFAQTSNPADELFAMAFNERVANSMDGHPLEAADVRGLEAELRGLRAEGQTALYDGLAAGLDRLDHALHARKVLLLISDGGDNASEATLDEVLARAKRSNVAIYTIGLFDARASDKNPKVLQSLARATGGQRFLPASPSGLLAVCQRIAREIRSGYTIAFTPPSQDGRYHRVRIEVTPGGDGRIAARTRPGYMSVNRALEPTPK